MEELCICVLWILFLHAYAASIGIRAQVRFLPWHEDHVGGRHAAVDGECERDEIACNMQLEARFSEWNSNLER